MTPLTLSIPEAGAVLGMSRMAAYRAATTGELPTIHLRTLRVPVAKLAEMVGPLSDTRIADAIAQVKQGRVS